MSDPQKWSDIPKDTTWEDVDKTQTWADLKDESLKAE